MSIIPNNTNNNNNSQINQKFFTELSQEGKEIYVSPTGKLFIKEPSKLDNIVDQIKDHFNYANNRRKEKSSKFL